MKFVTTAAGFRLLNLGYAIGLVALIGAAGSQPDNRDIVLGLGPVALTAVLLIAQYLLTWHEAAAVRAERPTGAHANYLWAWILLLYIVVALYDAAVNGAFSGGGY